MLKEAEAIPLRNWIKTILSKAFRRRVESEDVVNIPTDIQTDAVKDTSILVWTHSNSEPICVPGFRPRVNFSIDSNVINSTKRHRKLRREHGMNISLMDLDDMGINEMLEAVPESDSPLPKVVIAGSTGRVERGFILGKVCIMSSLGDNVG